MGERLDQLLVSTGLATSRTQAQKYIRSKRVAVQQAGQWVYVEKVSAKFDVSTLCRVDQSEDDRYVSRAGIKLAGALEHVTLDVSGLVALDVGQSTGGFTDCLLQQGAKRVVGVDVGHSQLVPQLRDDERVCVIEKTNARYLTPESIEAASGESEFDLIVMDVSFISQSLILPQLAPLLSPKGALLSLVKPQFEAGASDAGKKAIGKGGIVTDERLYLGIQERLSQQVCDLGLELAAYFDSPILGGDGNREFFLFAKLADRVDNSDE